MAPLTPFQNAAGWTLTLKAAEPAGGSAAALGALAAAAPLPGPLAGTAGVVKLGHATFRADVTVAKAIGLDGGRVKVVVEAMPFRLIQDILGAYETAGGKVTPSKAKGALTGTLKLFWRVGLPYPGLAEAADLLQSSLGVGDADADVAAEFVVTGLSVESEKVSYRLVIEGVDKAWHALGTERVAKPLALAKPADIEALCEQLGVPTGPAGGAGGGLPDPGALLGGAAPAPPAPGGREVTGGQSTITPRERILDRLADMQAAVADAAKAGGLGGFLLDNGRLLIGPAVVAAFKAPPVDLRGGLEVIAVQAQARDPADATGAEQAFSLRVRGNPAIKPGRVVQFRYRKPGLTSPSTGLGYADAAIGLATDPLGLGAGGDPVCLYVRAVRHRLSSSVGFVTEVDGIACGGDKPEMPKRPDGAGRPASSGGQGADAAAGAIHTAINRLQPRTVDIGEVRTFRAQGKGAAPGQTADAIIGLAPGAGQAQRTRTVDVQREDPQRAGAVPYVTSFAWGPFGQVLPRYPGTRVALLRPEGSPDQAVDLGALWWSGKADNAGAGPAEARDGDHWLILPVDPVASAAAPEDTAAIQPNAAGASHDLIDNAGSRTIHVGELTVRVGEWTVKGDGHGPGDRPAPAAAPGGVRIEGKDGTALIAIDKDGNITLSTPKTLTLSADEGVTLKSRNITAVLKDGTMDVS